MDSWGGDEQQEVKTERILACMKTSGLLCLIEELRLCVCVCVFRNARNNSLTLAPHHGNFVSKWVGGMGWAGAIYYEAICDLTSTCTSPALFHTHRYRLKRLFSFFFFHLLQTFISVISKIFNMTRCKTGFSWCGAQSRWMDGWVWRSFTLVDVSACVKICWLLVWI